MPYTLMKGLVWVLLAVLLGIVIGWLLRSVAAKRQVERARAATNGTAEQPELERLRNRVANLEPLVTERDRLRTELATERRRAAEAAPDDADRPRADASEAEPGPTSDEAVTDEALATGRPFEQDDLTAISGLSAQVAELCHGIGIRTWAELSATEVSLLRTMLTDAGQRFKAVDPSGWPQQAALLAAGDWDGFAALAGDDADPAGD